MARQTINIGSSPNKGDGEPLRTAFDKINDNFAELYSTVIGDSKGSIFGDDSTTLVDAVNSSINLNGTVKGNIIPDTNVAYDIGSASKRFKDLYLSGNTINLGGTAISVENGELKLGGVKIPSQTDLDTSIADVTAGKFSFNITGDDSTVRTVQSGSNISIKGVTNITTASDVNGNITITGPDLSSYLTAETSHADVVVDGDFTSSGFMKTDGAGNYSVDTVQYLSSVSLSQVSGVEINDAQDNQILSYNAGSEKWVNADLNWGNITGTPTTLAGYNISDAATSDQPLSTTDDVTFNTVSLGNGAVIKDNADSSVSFGGGAGATNQGAGAVAIGEGAGNNTQSNQAVAIGRGSGNYQQGVGAVGVGFCAGATEQGDYAVAIGFKAARGNMDNDGTPNQPANSIMINASSTPLNGNQAGLYINPVREDTGNITKAIYYNTTTKELTYADPTGGGGDGANLVSDNDINITINSPDSTTYSWNFNQLGRIQIPDVNNQVAGYIGDVFETGGGLTLQSVAGGYVELTSSDQNIGFWIQELNGGDPLVNAEATLYTTGGEWSFYQDGRTAFPGSIDLGGYDLKRSSTLVERYGGVGSASGNVAVLDKYRHMTLNNQIGTVLTGNFTVNFTSVDLPSGYIARFSVFLRQGATGYYPNVFQINGVTQTLVWDGGTPPTPTSSAGAVDVFEFILYSGGSFGTATGRAILSSSSGGGEVVDDTTPQLGGNLDVNGNSIVSVSDGDINLAPNGSGEVTVTGNATISNVAKAYEMIVTSSNAALKLGDGTGSEGYMNIYLNNVSGGAKHIIQSYPTAGGGFKIQNLVNDQAITFETKNSSGTTKTPLILNGDGSVTFGSILTLPVLSSAPSSPSNGMVAIADGTNWNPTSTGTETMVVYLGGAWRTIANA